MTRRNYYLGVMKRKEHKKLKIKKLFTALFTLALLSGLLVAASGCTNNTTGANITVYTRDTTSGTRDGFFTKIGFSEAKEDNSYLVDGYVEVDGNGSMIAAIKNDEYGIGYISLSTLSSSGVKGLTYEGIEPTEANVLNGTYSLTRNFNYCVRKEFTDSQVEAIVEAFEAFLTTSDAKTTMIEKGGIVSVSSANPTWDSIKANYPICNEDNSSITIKFGGSTSVESMAKALSAEFSAKCGNFVAEHNHKGSGDAYKSTQGSEKDGANYLDIAFLSREFNESETPAQGTYGKMCIDAIVVVVNNSNSLSAITTEEIKSIYNGTITKWSEISN